jgi:C1A family cysteine protease
MKQIIAIFLALALFSTCTSKSKKRQLEKEEAEKVTEETFEFATGLVFNDEEYSQIPMKASLTRGLYASIPTNYSLKEYCPSPKSQSKYGTCVGWASANARTILYAKNKRLANSDEIDRNRFSPLFIYRSIKSGDANCNQGSYIESAMSLLKKTGVVKFEDFKHLCVDRVPQSLTLQAEKYKIEDYVRLFHFVDSKYARIEATKKSISEGNPVVIGMKCPNSFQRAGDLWEPEESYVTEWGGHAMCVIGYDDEKHGGAFELMNSWGSNWGNSGFTWVTYTDYANFTRNAFELINNIKAPPEPEVPDLSGDLKFILENGNVMNAQYQQNRGLSVVSAMTQGYYKMSSPYSSGTNFRLYISNNEPAYVYAISSDNTFNINQLFPHEKGISPILNYKQNEIAIPDEEHYIQMDNTAGTDVFCLLYSKEALDIEEIITIVKNTEGSFSERLEKALSLKLVDINNIEFEKNNISFSAYSNNKAIVPIIVKIEHSK